MGTMALMLDASHHGPVHGMTGENSRSLQRSTTTLSSLDGTLSVHRIAESVNNTTKKGRTNWNIDNLTGTLDGTEEAWNSPLVLSSPSSLRQLLLLLQADSRETQCTRTLKSVS
jgi:hypothetical protein